MSHKDKPGFHVGQLLCGGFEGSGVTSQAYHLIVEHHVSTMIVSRKNAVSVKQITKLIRDLQYIAYSAGQYKYPLMFAIDEEGGLVNSLFDAEYLTQFPGAMALSAMGDTDLVYKVLKALAYELKQIGFLIIFGPVLDIVTKLSHQLVGVRSFGTTVEEVVKNGRACAKGFRDGGLFCFGKHFPGIGNASVDSLLELPMLADSLDQVRHFNAVPFKELIKEDLLDGISAAGCGVPTISPDEVHACLSPVVLNQLLRTELGFNGVVISECLEMDSLHHSIGLGQGVILALYAGCDLVLVCDDPKLQNIAVDSMNKALNNGNLDEEVVLIALARIEKLQKGLPTWKDLFPKGEESAKGDIKLLKDEMPDLWESHQQLSALAYQKSITLVRDFPGVLPITKFLNKSGGKNVPDKTNNILLLTPLLVPFYKAPNKPESKLYNGEEVFREFGNMLSDHPFNSDPENSYNVLHTTYTANGLTSLHETLIENSKVVIVITSEASRNMYQIGIVKYVSILCGANPTSLNSTGQMYSQLSKPLILVATSSPYDFFYNKSIGSAYLCSYDYTNSSLRQLVRVLMGDITAEGCIPGEKKYVSRAKKRRSTDTSHELVKARRSTAPKRRWLVDEFKIKRDWDGLVTLIKNNNFESLDFNMSLEKVNKQGSVNFQDTSFYDQLFKLLLSDQKHFVVRNSSLNIIYGIVLTWVNEVTNTGSIMYILVDKSKRLQDIGRNLHVRAIRYLTREKNCTSLSLGVSLPLMILPNDSNIVGGNHKAISFMRNFGWDVGSKSKLPERRIMLLKELKSWQVPQKIIRELMIVGIRFDVCNDPQKLLKLIDKDYNSLDHAAIDASNDDAIISDDGEHSKLEYLKNEKDYIKTLYLQAIEHLNNENPDGVRIIIALEPTNQSVIGSIILFTSKSPLAKLYPFIGEALHEGEATSYIERSVGAIVAPVIDPLYSNLTEIFRYGLICSGITLLKSNSNDIDECLMIGVGDDKTSNLNGIKEIGFQDWKYYYDNYDKKTNLDVFKHQ